MGCPGGGGGGGGAGGYIRLTSAEKVTVTGQLKADGGFAGEGGVAPMPDENGDPLHGYAGGASGGGKIWIDAPLVVGLDASEGTPASGPNQPGTPVIYTSELRIRAGFGDDPDGAPGKSTPAKGDTPVEARFPLGSLFFIQLVSQQADGAGSEAIQAEFDLDAAQVEAGAVILPALFPNHVAIEFNREPPGEYKLFRAIHLGQVVLTIKPTDSSIPEAKVRIIVERPESLGQTNNMYDDELVDHAHLRGIPPDILKGQVHRESLFDLSAYRYEPFAHDQLLISRGSALRERNPTPSTDWRLIRMMATCRRVRQYSRQTFRRARGSTS